MAVTTPPIAYKSPVKQPINLPPIDIAYIRAKGFYQNITKSNIVTFVTSLYKINHLIEEKEIKAIWDNLAQEELSNKELIKQKLLYQFSNYKDIFSKAKSNILPLHHLYNLKIELEGNPNLGYSPLRHHMLEELQACKQYLVENLSKGFIDDSQAPFAAPILFARKANGGLRFCVDYRKLNSVTRKDPLWSPRLNNSS